MDERKNIIFSNIKLLKEVKNFNVNSCKNYNRNLKTKNFFCNIDGKNYKFNSKRDTKSYIYLNTYKHKLNLNNLHLLTESNKTESKTQNNKIEYYLPVLMSKKIEKREFPTFEHDISNRTIKPILSKSITYKNHLSKNSMDINFNKIINVYKNHDNNLSKYQKNSDIMSQIKNYRKKIREQILNRSKFIFPRLNLNITSKINNPNIKMSLKKNPIKILTRNNAIKKVNRIYEKVPIIKDKRLDKKFIINNLSINGKKKKDEGIETDLDILDINFDSDN